MRAIGILAVLLSAWMIVDHANAKGKMVISGRSMEHLGFYAGQRYSIEKRVPKIGDVVAFECEKDLCPSHFPMLKQVVGEHNGCLWVQGRNDEWKKEDGTLVHSLDSRKYGWLCQEEIKILGVIENENHPEAAQVPVCQYGVQPTSFPEEQTPSGDQATGISGSNEAQKEVQSGETSVYSPVQGQ